jgi:hypothetical protein
MYAWDGGTGGIGISLPLEELPEWEMLHNRELTQHFCIVHLQHTLVDLAPSVFDARDIEQYGRVFPERTFLDIKDELNGTEIHIA